MLSVSDEYDSVNERTKEISESVKLHILGVWQNAHEIYQATGYYCAFTSDQALQAFCFQAVHVAFDSIRMSTSVSVYDHILIICEHDMFQTTLRSLFDNPFCDNILITYHVLEAVLLMPR